MDKRSWILIGIIILMVGIMVGTGIWYLNGKKVPQKPPISQINPTTEPPPTEQSTSTPADTGTQTPSTPLGNQPQKQKPAPKKTTSSNPIYKGNGYDAVLNGYRAKGYFFQFDGCNLGAQSTQFNTGKGARFAILNSDKGSHVYKVFGGSYTLKLGDYVIVEAFNKGSHTIMCDGNVRAYININ
jgi:hypothetical protein